MFAFIALTFVVLTAINVKITMRKRAFQAQNEVLFKCILSGIVVYTSISGEEYTYYATTLHLGLVKCILSAFVLYLKSACSVAKLCKLGHVVVSTVRNCTFFQYCTLPTLCENCRLEYT